MSKVPATNQQTEAGEKLLSSITYIDQVTRKKEMVTEMKKVLDSLENYIMEPSKLLDLAYSYGDLVAFKILLSTGILPDETDPNCFLHTNTADLTEANRNTLLEFKTWADIAKVLNDLCRLETAGNNGLLDRLYEHEFIDHDDLSVFFKDSFSNYAKHNKLPDHYMAQFRACCDTIELENVALRGALLLQVKWISQRYEPETISTILAEEKARAAVLEILKNLPTEEEKVDLAGVEDTSADQG